jgi:hypothetical protein
VKYLIALLTLLLSINTLYAGNLTASVDRTTVHRHETLTLTLQYDARSSDDPDTTDLSKQFDIISRRQSTGISIVNGDISSNTTWEFELSPKTTGKLLIPSFSIGNDFSEAIAITVDDSAVTSTQTGQKIYTETAVDKNKVFTQQQVIVSWRLVSRAGTPEVQFTPPHIDGVIAKDLGSHAYTRASANGGSSEWVIEQRYALFPQHSGKITIPSQTFQAVVNQPQQHFSGMLFSVPTQVTLDTEEQHLEVIPPLSSNHPFWLPASSVDISQQISGVNQQSQATVGTAFTRTIHIQAQGLSAEQLPDIDTQANGFKVYAEKPTFDNKATQQGNIGTREDRMAIIPTQAGKLVLPAIHIPWYDVNTNQWREAVLPESTIEVLPAPNTTTSQQNAPTTHETTHETTQKNQLQTSPPSATPSSSHSNSNRTWAATYLWQIVVGVLLLILIALSIYVYRLQQNIDKKNNATDSNVKQNLHHKTMTSPKTPLDEIQNAIQASDWRTLHSALGKWATQLGNPAILQHPEIAAVMQAIEKYLYGSGAAPTPESAQALPALLKQLMDAEKNSRTHEKRPQLDKLYW